MILELALFTHLGMESINNNNENEIKEVMNVSNGNLSVDTEDN